MSDEQIKLHLKELNHLLEVKYPPLSGKVKLLRVPEDKGQLDLVGNEAGIIQWSLAMVSAAVLKTEMKPNLPGYLIVLDREWFTKDSDLQIRLYSCDENIRSKPLAYDDMQRERNETLLDRAKEGVAITIGCGGMLFAAYCVISTIIGWFR